MNRLMYQQEVSYFTQGASAMNKPSTFLIGVKLFMRHQKQKFFDNRFWLVIVIARDQGIMYVTGNIVPNYRYSVTDVGLIFIKHA